jgi:prepilin-type N-terminal cleavage/methylation domain-containing protein
MTTIPANLRCAYTLIEILLAMAIGLMVLNAAFVAFVNTGKFFHRIETISAKNDVAQSAIVWSIAKSSLDGYPTNTGQFRRIGVTGIDATPATYRKITIAQVDPSTPEIVKPITLVLPYPNL